LVTLIGHFRPRPGGVGNRSGSSSTPISERWAWWNRERKSRGKYRGLISVHLTSSSQMLIT
jgi:hypothetical protein